MCGWAAGSHGEGKLGGSVSADLTGAKDGEGAGKRRPLKVRAEMSSQLHLQDTNKSISILAKGPGRVTRQRAAQTQSLLSADAFLLIHSESLSLPPLPSVTRCPF